MKHFNFRLAVINVCPELLMVALRVTSEYSLAELERGWTA